MHNLPVHFNISCVNTNILIVRGKFTKHDAHNLDYGSVILAHFHKIQYTSLYINRK